MRHSRNMSQITSSIIIKTVLPSLGLLTIVWTQLWVKLLQLLWLHYPVLTSQIHSSQSWQCPDFVSSCEMANFQSAGNVDSSWKSDEFLLHSPLTGGGRNQHSRVASSRTHKVNQRLQLFFFYRREVAGHRHARDVPDLHECPQCPLLETGRPTCTRQTSLKKDPR